MSDSATATEAPSTPRGAHRGRGRSHQHNRTESYEQDSPENLGRGTRLRGARGARGGRGRGRAHLRDFTSSPATFSPQIAVDASSGRPPGGGFGVRLTGAASKVESDSQDPQSQQGGVGPVTGEEVEVCFICASPIEHISIAPCNHQTCHICSLRLRALYKTRACAHCRVSPSSQQCGLTC